MRRRTTTRPPVLERLVLPDLEEADAAQLNAQDRHDGLRLVGADLTGADLTGATFTECELVDVTAHTTVLQHARLLETRIERLNAPVLDATRSTWRDVELVGSRIGALDVYDAEIRSTRITGTKFDWINLRSSTLEDVLFEDCTIDELDLRRRHRLPRRLRELPRRLRRPAPRPARGRGPARAGDGVDREPRGPVGRDARFRAGHRAAPLLAAHLGLPASRVSGAGAPRSSDPQDRPERRRASVLIPPDSRTRAEVLPGPRLISERTLSAAR